VASSQLALALAAALNTDLHAEETSACWCWQREHNHVSWSWRACTVHEYASSHLFAFLLTPSPPHFLAPFQRNITHDQVKQVSALTLWRLAAPWLPLVFDHNERFALSCRVSPVDLHFLYFDLRHTQGSKDIRYQQRSPWSLVDPNRTGAATKQVTLEEATAKPPAGRIWREELFATGFVHVGTSA
jgi:hypothetical protein